MKSKESETKTCKYCKSEIPKGARICPNCRKKQSHIKGILVTFIILCFMFVTIIGHNSKENENSTGKGSSSNVHNKSSSEVSESDFETKSYLYKNEYGSCYYIVVIKNTSSVNASVSGNATAKDANGNSIGAADMSIEIIGAGETSLGYFVFDNSSEIVTVDCSLKYSAKTYYNPAVCNLETVNTVNNENVVVTATNRGENSAKFVVAYAIFFDSSNNVVDFDMTYITDANGELKPGETLSGELNCYSQFDHVEVYYEGRSEK